MKSLCKRAGGLSLHSLGEECKLSFNKPNYIAPGALHFCAGSSGNISPRLLTHEMSKGISDLLSWKHQWGTV